MSLLFALLGSALAQPLRCGTPALAPLAPLAVPPLSPAPPGEKAERDAYGGIPNSLSSENFIVRWGRTGGVTEEDAQALLDSFEESWAVEIEQMGHPAPTGSEAYLFNIYIGDTGSGTPPGYGAGGYYNSDSEGWPMVVIALDTLAEPDYAEITAAHEFYHAIQATIGTYSYSGNSAWYWEATAEWASGEVYPENLYYALFLFGYAFLPHLSVNAFDYADSGALEEYHQYGAFIFPRYLSERAADWSLIRDSWMLADDDDPLVVIDELLQDRGSSLNAAFADFAARNATWDYQDGDGYIYLLDYYADYYGDQDYRIAAEVTAHGTTGLVSGPEETRPQRYAYNLIRSARPDADAVQISVQAESTGSEGSPTQLAAVVVQDRAVGPSYTPIEIVDGQGSVTLDDLSQGGDLYLAVSTWSSEEARDETFAFAYAFTPITEGGDEGGDEGGGLGGEPFVQGDDKRACGCDSGPGAAGLLASAVVGAALSARRRRGCRPAPRLPR